MEESTLNPRKVQPIDRFSLRIFKKIVSMGSYQCECPENCVRVSRSRWFELGTCWCPKPVSLPLDHKAPDHMDILNNISLEYLVFQLRKKHIPINIILNTS